MFIVLYVLGPNGFFIQQTTQNKQIKRMKDDSLNLPL